MRYPLEMELRPAGLMLALNAAIHSIAAFAFLYSSLPLLLVVAALGWLVFSFRTGIRVECEKAGFRLVLDENGELRLDPGGDGRRVVYASVDASCVDFGWAVWLHWRGTLVPRSRRVVRRGAMMLVAANLRPEDWRGLRIWLRHKASVAERATATDDGAPARRQS